MYPSAKPLRKLQDTAPDNSVAIVLKDKLSEADPADDSYPKDLYLRDSQNQTDVLISKLSFVSLKTSSTGTENLIGVQQAAVNVMKLKARMKSARSTAC